MKKNNSTNQNFEFLKAKELDARKATGPDLISRKLSCRLSPYIIDSHSPNIMNCNLLKKYFSEDA